MEELDRLLLEKVEDLVIKDDKLRSYQSTFTIVKNILNSKWENAKVSALFFDRGAALLAFALA